MTNKLLCRQLHFDIEHTTLQLSLNGGSFTLFCMKRLLVLWIDYGYPVLSGLFKTSIYTGMIPLDIAMLEKMNLALAQVDR